MNTAIVITIIICLTILTLSLIGTSGNTTSEVVLTDDTTGKRYKLHVSQGNLTMTEFIGNSKNNKK